MTGGVSGGTTSALRKHCYKPDSGIPVSGCATVRSGAIHTTKQAGNLPDSEVFSRPNTLVLGLGVPNRKAGSTTCFVWIYPAPPYGLASQKAGFQSQQGAETMTTVTTTTPTMGITSPIARQQAIENALSLALWHIRQDVAPKHIHAATVKAVRAAAMLKHACAESSISGVTA